jgi:type 1 glutamine amidotransferase
MLRHLIPLFLLAVPAFGQDGARLNALIVDGLNNHDWQAGTRAIRSILEGSGRFRVDVCTWPCKPEFGKYAVVIDNFNGGHTETGTRWPRDTEIALEKFVHEGGGLVVFHAANNAFLKWPEFNEMIGLGWREPSFGPGLAVVDRKVTGIPKGSGLPPGHGPRHDFEMFVLEKANPITAGLPAHWTHPSEQLTHGQHGPADGLTVLTYAFSEVSQQGEPMDWVKQYGKGRVYTTMLGHTWAGEANPNLDDVNFQGLLARGAEWAATGKVTLPADLRWKPLFNGKDLTGWEPRGNCIWTVMEGGVLLGQRTHGEVVNSTQAWLYTKREFGNFDLHAEYWLPPGGNSGISIRDNTRAAGAIAAPVSTTPAHVGYEIQILDDDAADYPSGSVYLFQRAKTGVHRHAEWNSMDIESRAGSIRVFLNGQLVAESAGDPARAKTGPVGLQLHDRFSFTMFRNIRIREVE